LLHQADHATDRAVVKSPLPPTARRHVGDFFGRRSIGEASLDRSPRAKV
jgi:hypothetical protein